MTDNNTQLAVSKANEQQTLSVFSNTGAFEQAQRFATALCKSSIVPAAYQNNIPNTLVALEMANRMGESPLMVMQNLDIIHGRPSFNSKFTISRLNTCGRFTPLRFRYSGEGDNRTCVAWAKDTATGEVLEGPPVSITMAKKEGWFSKRDRNGNETSKWQTMPELMLMYRAGTFFGRVYAPELTMGMQTTDELQDIGANVAPVNSAIADLNSQAVKVDTAPKRSRKREQPSVTVDAEATVIENHPATDSQPEEEELM
jgi:hypothetical protein